MTKMKSRKMTKSTFAIIIMGIAMVAMLAFGGTFAYFTATTEAESKTATTGIIQLGANTVGTFTANVVSGEEIFAEGQKVTVLNKSNRDAYIFITFTVEVLDENGDAIVGVSSRTKGENETPAQIEAALAANQYCLDYVVTNSWTALPSGIQTKAIAADQEHGIEAKAPAAVTGVYYYHASAVSAASLSEGVSYDVCTSVKFYGKSNSTEAGIGSLMNAQIKLTVTSSAIQFDQFDNVSDAFIATNPSVYEYSGS